jgi:hypothetical protein
MSFSVRRPYVPFNFQLSTFNLSCLLLLLASPACSGPRILWSQQVSLNGRNFVFSRIDSLTQGPEGHRIEYRDGNFTIRGPGMIMVNGFEISAEVNVVVLANQRLELKPGEEVHFSRDMEWTVHPGAPAAPEPSPPLAAESKLVPASAGPEVEEPAPPSRPAPPAPPARTPAPPAQPAPQN